MTNSVKLPPITMPAGGVHGNSGILAHKVGHPDWKPGDILPEHYRIYTVSEGETCKFCDKLKARLNPMVKEGLLTYEVVPLSREARQKLYDSLSLKDNKRCVPQFSLMDRRSDIEQPIGGSAEANVWLDTTYQDSFELMGTP
mgnify:CR=1 FL=1